ncbi:MAG: cell division protein CrgA [Verrucomicrobiota bacterium]|nr:cell division protein CrgA [Chthoniobacterales bacterium]MDQ3414238.1 cell division protein CrgA [Verrucomicrobiota bacterium]
MIYSISLQAAGLIAGLLLALLSLCAVLLPARNFLPQFPRSRVAGALLLTIDVIWSLWLLATMEMGEFSSFRRPLLVILPIGFFLVLRFVDEFLAVRALGILFLLAAEPLLNAAFLRPETSRLLVTVLAYLMIVAGLIWVTMPYLLRDQIQWSVKSDARWRLLSGFGFVFGALIVVCAFVVY